MAVEQKVTYGLDSVFEHVVAECCAARPEFFKRIGLDIDPSMIGGATPKLVIEACRAIAMDGSPPSSPILVRQRLQTWGNQGKLTADQIDDANELLQAAIEDAHGFDVDGVITELSMTLKRALEKRALEVGLKNYSSRGSQAQTEQLLQHAKRIGTTSIGVGSRIGTQAFPGMLKAMRSPRMELGIEDLDGELKGGMKLGTFTLITAAAKGGKSMTLDHAITHSMTNCIPSAIATMELSEADHHARIVGNLTDLAYDDILQYDDVERIAMERLSILEEDGMIAFCSIKAFPPNTTTLEDIEEWIDAEEATFGVKIRMLGIDYGQLLGFKDSKKSRNDQLTLISERARAMAQERSMCVLIPSTATTEGMNTKKTKLLENHHTADSRGLPKACDLHITINPRDDGASLLWHIAGNRHGGTGGQVGPLPHEFEKGRVGPIKRSGWPF